MSAGHIVLVVVFVAIVAVATVGLIAHIPARQPWETKR